jgi:hypothetical protein
MGLAGVGIFTKHFKDPHFLTSISGGKTWVYGYNNKTKQQQNTITANNILINKSLMNFEAFLASGFQAFVNKVGENNGYTQVIRGLTGGDALLDIYLLRPDNSLTSCNIVPSISDHSGVLLEVEWDEICREQKRERIVPLYHKTNVLGLQTFLREKFTLEAGNGSCVEEIWKSYRDTVFEGMERSVPHKSLSKNPDPEYYDREVKRLKVKVRRAYNKRKFGGYYQEELKRRSYW